MQDQLLPNPDLLSEDQAAAYLSVRPQTLAVWRSTGRYGLPFVRCGRLVRYRRADLDRWLESRLVTADEE
jgi:excisionase family DNA binding protein